MDDTFDRLEDLDLERVFEKSKDLKGDLSKPNKAMKAQNSKELNDFLMQGKRAPRQGDTISEICD